MFLKKKKTKQKQIKKIIIKNPITEMIIYGCCRYDILCYKNNTIKNNLKKTL